MPDLAPHARFKLGRIKSHYDPRTLRLARYLPVLPAIPEACDWTPKVKAQYGTLGTALLGGWRMMENDQLGDCAIADPGHAIMTWTANVGSIVIPADSDIEKAYEVVGGYDPGNSFTDNGCEMIDVRKYWASVGIAGHKIAAYIYIGTDPAKIKTAIYLAEGAGFGLALPAACQHMGTTWDVPAGQNLVAEWYPGSWGGHAVRAVAYDAVGVYVISWGDEVLPDVGIPERVPRRIVGRPQPGRRGRQNGIGGKWIQPFTVTDRPGSFGWPAGTILK